MVGTAGIEVGRRLREARRARRMTQARLARKAGVKRETVYRTEAGRLPTADTAARLCDALGLDRDALDLGCAETDAFVAHPPFTLLRDRRRALGLTLEHCAAEAEVSAATLSRFERGIERSAKLVRFDRAGWPVELTSAGMADVLGFRTLKELNRYWRTGRL